MVDSQRLKIVPTGFARPTVKRTAEVSSAAIRPVACNPFRGACVWRPALPAGPSWTSARAPRRQAGLQVLASGPTRDLRADVDGVHRDSLTGFWKFCWIVSGDCAMLA